MNAIALPALNARLRLPTILLVYLAAFVHGLTLVSFPASSAVLQGSLGLSDAEYGTIFLPQVVLALIGALGGGMLSQRFGLQRLLWLSLLALAGSQAALIAAGQVPASASFAVVCVGTGLLGLGFGLGGAPLNGYVGELFSRGRNAALVGLHSLVGTGLALGPVLIAALPVSRWTDYPFGLIIASLLLALLAATPLLTLQQQASTAVSSSPAVLRSRVFWLFALSAVLYAFAEGVFSNWAVVYVSEVRQLPVSAAGAALSAFWAALVAGRLLVSLLLLRLPAALLWLILPLLMMLALLLLPQVDSERTAIGYFALAGMACSAFFPLTIALVSEQFPNAVAQVSSLLIAALMLGVGLGSTLIGALRSVMSMESLYQASVLFPLSALLFGVLALHHARRSSLRKDAAS